MFKGSVDIDVHEQAFIAIGAMLIGIMALAAVYININPSLANTPKARTSLTANTLAFYLASLSSVDAGTIVRDLNGTYVVQIGKYSGLKRLVITRPVNNYYLKVILYDDAGSELSESEEVSFIGNIEETCEKPGICMDTGKVDTVRFTKNEGEPVRLEGFLMYPGGDSG